jgi:hypothetical protein
MLGTDTRIVSSSIINFNLAIGANVTMSNVLFLENTFSGTKAIVA